MALFYASGLATQEINALVAGVATMAIARIGDVISFAEGGGEAQRDLAIPLLPDMDHVLVSDARLRVRAREREMTVSAPVIGKTVGDNVGVTVDVGKPSRLRRVVLRATFHSLDPPVRHRMPGFAFSTPASSTVTTTKDDLRVAVRPVLAGGAFGPPVLIEPGFPTPPLYQPVQAGLSLAVVEQGALQITFPSTAGTAWLIQLVAAEEATKLAPLPFDGEVTRVTVNAVPENVEIVARGGGADDPPISIWSNPNPLPEAGTQDVIFTPAAQRLLSQRLASSGGSEPTLPVSLSFSSSAGGDLDIVSSVLAAGYEVEPFGPQPVKVILSGAWTPVLLSAPRGVRPVSGTAALTARYLGNELNAGSPLPPLDPPSTGVRASSTRWAAAPLTVVGTGPLAIVSSHLYIQAIEPAEVVVELREDVAGAPAARAGEPVVLPLDVGPAGWLSFDLPEPLLRDAGTPLWVAVRTTLGAVLWFGAAAAPASLAPSPAAMVSVDEGRTWGVLDEVLGPSSRLLAQLFHARDPAPTMDVAVDLSGTVVAGISLVRTSPPADPASPLPHRGEYAGQLSVPAAVMSALAATLPGAGRAETAVRFFSRSVADLTVSGATLSYDPFG